MFKSNRLRHEKYADVQWTTAEEARMSTVVPLPPIEGTPKEAIQKQGPGGRNASTSLTTITLRSPQKSNKIMDHPANEKGKSTNVDSTIDHHYQ